MLDIFLLSEQRSVSQDGVGYFVLVVEYYSEETWFKFHVIMISNYKKVSELFQIV
jgi:hypothetical protein